ncbi:MAG: TAT-variant-translocated molybdopterin oxidoreductase [Kouleothrix sp.]|nr:TAT-variant-translocated molybdopterin oxidoreductase [Kouleothrix sp.]
MQDETDRRSLDLAAIRARLAGARGSQLWRSLEQLAETPEFQEFVRHEFPRGADLWRASLSRRSFLKLMGASLALAGLSACARPRETIVPYVRQPAEIVPGKPLYYASALTLDGIARGVLVESHEGRPTKIEGNPRHPDSLGATDMFGQAAILGLYDPDRSQAVINVGRISTWEAFVTALTARLQALAGGQGAGLRLLTGTITSPALAAQIEALLARYPAAQWHQYQPAGRDSALEGARLAFGQPVDTLYRFDQAERILSLDADVLLHGPGSLRYARDLIDGRRVRQGQARMNRLYAVESMPTITGAMADHRLPLRASLVEPFAREVAARLGVGGVGAPDQPSPIPGAWTDALARDLQASRGKSIVIAGDQQPPIVHALAHAINEALGNTGATVLHIPPVAASPANGGESLRALAADMAAGKVSLLVTIDCNPAFDAPADLGFAQALARVAMRVHTGLYADETASLSHWHIPAAHPLEAWGDARAFDGTVSIVQPLIAPLHGGISPHELLAALLGQTGGSSYEIVRGYWQGQRGGADFEQFWRQSLHDGVVEGTAFAPIQVSVRPGALSSQAARPTPQNGLELVFRPDPTIWDGRFANNAWLQELPKPMTTLTWDNVALLSPATAERLGLSSEDVVELRLGGRAVRAPAWVMPGHADDAVTLFFGYGRTIAGQVGSNIGYNAYALRSSGAPWIAGGAELVRTGERYPLAPTQDHFAVDGSDLVKLGTLAEFQQNPNFIHGAAAAVPGEGLPSLLPEYRYDGHRWAMTIDTNACIGCNACVVACQAENNIPVVGKPQVQVSREMHWLKVDRYYTGGADNPAAVFQPRPCQQCEQAPCELVCPVAATVHSAEGLNDMVYNRCVGTRYCSNNCPYKVRRFNFLQYSDQKTPVIQLMHNPDVTVRDRGVMEKCTYCVQRISAGRIAAERDGRPLRDGEVKTACQESCPTGAIVFGDLNDPASQVAQLKAQPLNYGLLAELGTQPRTSYLARLRNPNPEIPV